MKLDGKPAFYKEGTDDCRVLVHRDSPKSSFTILHRTDYYSMFHALSEDDQLALTHHGEVPLEIWPQGWPDPKNYYLFPLPYRADPPDGDIAQYRALGWEGDGQEDRNETWSLMEHGPTLEEWWRSVVQGRQILGGLEGPTHLRKDAASPPPGLRGRNPALIDTFPQEGEDKIQYYSMGSFPMDRSGPTPLAVFEHRAFADIGALAEMEPLTYDKWADVVRVFHKLFVPR